MRSAFVVELTELAAADPRVMLVTGDLGFGVLTEFAGRFPKQYLNAGVAEQNMTALAVGLALEGRIVYTYSIANFPTLRCLEQIRNDACYHRANVKIVSVGGGFAYGALGMSHHATEDIAVMRALPAMCVLAPGDPGETSLATKLAYRTDGVCYLRLGRGGEKRVHSNLVLELHGDPIQICAGTEVVLLSTGGILGVANDACALLRSLGIGCALYSVPVIKPFPSDFVRKISTTATLIVTIEEHSVIGGLGGAVAEVLAESGGRTARLVRCGIKDQYSSVVGTQDYLRGRYGIDVGSICAAVQTQLAL